MYAEPEKLRPIIAEARETAASIRLRYDRGQPTDTPTRKAATLLLTLADELEAVRPELRASADEQ